MNATIVITTKDRRDDLRIALTSVAAQRDADFETLVIDDGSADGTSEMVQAEFPDVRLHRSDRSLGYITQRNRAAQLALGEIIVSIDDDARFISPWTVARTLRDFDHPRVGAVAIPFVDARRGRGLLQAPPDVERSWVTSTYRGTAHAVRRDVFLSLGGYRDALVHQAEEPDFCLRMLDAGYVTRLGRADPIEHHESPQRDIAQLIRLGRRNDLLHGWSNVPFPYLPIRLAKVTLHSLVFAIKWRQPRAVARGLVDGWTDGLRGTVPRRPVSRDTYRLDHRIRARGPLVLDDVESGLAPLPNRPHRAGPLTRV